MGDSRVAGRYRLIERIARGRTGSVWMARDEVLGRQVAVKLIAPGFGHDPEFRRRFLREARAAAARSHPNIVAVHDYGEFDGKPFLVRELLTGPTLADLFAVPDPERVIGQVAAAMAAAHAAGVVHGDLKPQDVFVTASAVKVLGLGVVHDARKNTLAYPPPEPAGSPAGDVYALGMLWFEVVTGRRPRRGETLGDLQERCVAAFAAERPAAAEVAAVLGGRRTPARRTRTASGGPAAPAGTATSGHRTAAGEDPPDGDRAAALPGRVAAPGNAVAPGRVAAPGNAVARGRFHGGGADGRHARPRAPAASAGHRADALRRYLPPLAVSVAVAVTAVSLTLATGFWSTRPHRAPSVPPLARPRAPLPSVSASVPVSVPVRTPSHPALVRTRRARPPARPRVTAPPTGIPPTTAALNALAHMRRLVDQGKAVGEVRSDVALDFDNIIGNLMNELNTGRPVEIHERAAELRNKVYTRLRENGLTQDRADRLIAAISGL